MSNILELKNVTAYRGDTRVFDRLSLDLRAGQNTAILGPNGAGKTTLLKLLARDIYPVADDRSVLRIFGQEHWNVWDLRARLGIVSHDLQRDYTGNARGINVVLSGYYSSIDVWKHQKFTTEDRTRAQHIMAQLGIADLQDKLYATMSTGEQRRFLLARALINEPEALVLDEPTSGLDLRACFQYIDLVRKLMRAGKTIILVTHHIHEIPPEISRAILLKSGRVIADGEKSAVLTSENLSALFDTPVQLLQANGFYQAAPAETSETS